MMYVPICNTCMFQYVTLAHLIQQQYHDAVFSFLIRVDEIIQLLVGHRWASYATLHPAIEELYVNAPRK